MASLNPMAGTLGKRLAAHLLRRATYVPTRTNIDIFATMTADTAVDALMNINAPTMAEPIDWETGQPWINSGVAPISNTTRLRDYIKAWWINEARQDLSIGHKMQFFLHSCWVVAATEGYAAEYFDYLSFLRHYAVGNYKQLAIKLSIDNQMLRYLDNNSNRVGNPNENYAREFFELFTIGKGPQIGPGNYTNYTETDIVEAAKLLTGWVQRQNRNIIDPATGIPVGEPLMYRHDTSTKQFSAAFGKKTIHGATNTSDIMKELREFVDMVFDQDETAKFTCRRLYRYFVHDNITSEIETDVIEPLAILLKSNSYELAPVLKKLLKSEHFYDADDSDNSDEIVGGLMRSPLEMALNTINFFDITIPDPITNTYDHYHDFYKRGLIDSFFALSGMSIFLPTDVAGYPAYYQGPSYTKNWFNSSTIITRYKMGDMFIRGKRVFSNGNLKAQLDIVNWVADPVNISNPADATILVNEMIEYLLAEMPDTPRMNYFLNDIFLDNLAPTNWTMEWNNYLTTNDDSAVKIALNNLVEALLYSQEFQMM